MFNYCNAQQNNSAPDSIYNNKFLGQVSFGLSIPVGNFPQSFFGVRGDITGKYFFCRYVALMIKAGYDINGYSNQDNSLINPICNSYPYTYQQYLGGICCRIFSKKDPNLLVHFIAHGGLALAGTLAPEADFAYNSSGIIGIGEVNSGNGTGFAYYFGVEFTRVTKRKKIISLGVGYLGSSISYSNFTYEATGFSNTPYAGLEFSEKSPQQYMLGEIQPYFGIGFY